jgi:hypothetical protein
LEHDTVRKPVAWKLEQKLFDPAKYRATAFTTPTQVVELALFRGIEHRSARVLEILCRRRVIGDLRRTLVTMRANRPTS